MKIEITPCTFCPDNCIHFEQDRYTLENIAGEVVSVNNTCIHRVVCAHAYRIGKKDGQNEKVVEL